MSKYNTNQKAEIIARYQSGETVMNLTATTGIPRSTIYSWLKDIDESLDKNQKISLKNYRILEAKVKLQGEYSVHVLCDAFRFLIHT